MSGPRSRFEAHRNTSYEFLIAVCLALADGDDVIVVGSTSIRPMEIFMSGSRRYFRIISLIYPKSSFSSLRK